MAETNTLTFTRDATTWPKHRAKARQRNSLRKKTAREAQTRIDQARNSK